MKFWRNPEIRKIIFISFFITLGLFLLSLLLAPQHKTVIVVISLLWLLLFISFEYQKYKKIKRLNDDLDKILFEEKLFPLDDYKEGELSILVVNIEKILLRLKESNDRLLQDKNYLSDHLADVSHQIRTPLASLNLLVDRLKNSKDEQEKRQLIQKIMLITDRISRLIESLLLMSKLDAGAIEFNLNKHDFSALIDQVLNNLAINIELKNIKIKQNVKGKTYADEFWLIEALTNLIKNAIEHSNENGRIEIIARQNIFGSEIFIRDYGPGISKQDRAHIFERFYRGDNAAENSIGIGLALAKQLIQLQNGEISVKSTTKADLKSNGSETTTGTTFHIKFYHRVI